MIEFCVNELMDSLKQTADCGKLFEKAEVAYIYEIVNTTRYESVDEIDFSAFSFDDLDEFQHNCRAVLDTQKAVDHFLGVIKNVQPKLITGNEGDLFV